MFAYAWTVIRIRGVPISDDEARELARLLAGDEAAAALVARIGRALEDVDGGLIATSRLEARATLFAVQRMLSRREHSERLLELRVGLVAMLREAERMRPPTWT
jgi:anti-sigma factor RsiW